MSLWFQWRAANAVVKRRPSSVIRMVLVAFVGCLWILIGGTWLLGNYRQVQAEAAEVQMEMFLIPDVSDSAAQETLAQVGRLSSVTSSRLIHEDDVWAEFTKEVGTADDLRAVVRMPRIIRLRIDPDLVSTAQFTLMASSLRMTYASVCQEVVWPRPLVASLSARRKDLLAMGGVVSALTFILFAIALTYAFRSELNRAHVDLAVARSIGASHIWTSLPHIVTACMSAVVGVTLAWLGVVTVRRQLDLAWLQEVHPQELLVLASVVLLLGCILSTWQGLIAATMALRVRRPA